MNLDTQTLKKRIEKDLWKLNEMRSRLQARLKAIEIVERTAGELQPKTYVDLRSILESAPPNSTAPKVPSTPRSS